MIWWSPGCGFVFGVFFVFGPRFYFLYFGFYLVDLLELIQYHFRRFMVNALDATISCTYPFFERGRDHVVYEGQLFFIWLAGISILKFSIFILC